MTDDVSRRDLQRDIESLKGDGGYREIPLFGWKRDDGTLVDECGNQIETAIYVCRNDE